jgi:hypothetical protein
MSRSPFATITETIFRRKKVIPGWIYIRKAPMGPPPAKGPAEEAIDDLIRDTAVSFDFSPLLSGDRRQAQKIAEDFMSDVRAAAEKDDLVDSDLLDARLKKLWPWWFRSLNTFRDRLKAALKTVR